LTELYISGNQITKVAPVVKLFPNLEILDVSHNNLESMEDVLELSKLEQLAELFIEGNPVAKLKECVTYIADYLQV
jgi:Leucine-rich repeat (LRR) protein